MSDYSACQFLSKTKLDVPLVYHSKQMAREMTNVIVPVLNKIYRETGVKPLIAYERNNGGVFEMERVALMNEGYYNVFKMPNVGKEHNPSPTRLGWDTNTATRPRMLTDLKEAIDNKLVTLYDKPTIEELYSFVITKTTTTEKAQAENGAHDDLVMSLAGAWQLQQTAMEPRSLPPDLNDFRKWKI